MIPLPRAHIGQTTVMVTTLGFGAAGIGNLYRALDDSLAQATLAAALDAGIGYIDTAPHYGQGLSERRVGQRLGMGLSGGPADIVVSTKVGRVLEPIAAQPPGTTRHGFVDGDPFEPRYDYSYDGVMRSFDDSLKRLRRDRIDILLAHDLGQATHGVDAALHMKTFLGSGVDKGGYRAMADLKASGLVSALGLGVNEWQVISEVLSHADLDSALLAGRYTLLEQGALTQFLPQCRQHGVSLILGGPYNSGILAGDVHYNYEVAPPEVTKRVRALQRVCEAHSVPLAAAALQFPLAHPAVVCVIPGMVGVDQVRANLHLLNLALPVALWDDLRSEGLIDPQAPTPTSAPVRGNT